MAADLETIGAFVMEAGDIRELPPPDADLFKVLGLDGDDCGEFLEAYRQRFNVNMSDFLWYLHHGEEVFSLGSFFFKPPNFRVAKIPITLRILHDCALAGRWTVQYPPHDLPKKRWDIILWPVWLGLTFAMLIALVLGAEALWRMARF